MRFRVLGSLLSVALLSSGGQAAQNATRGGVEYRVEPRPASRSFHVTAVFPTMGQQSLDVSLPVWTPGVYAAENYAEQITNLTARDAAGAARQVSTVRFSTWRIDTAGSDRITVAFDYAARSSPGWNRAAVTNRFAFFTGTELFLEAVGLRGTKATVRFVVPPGWKIASQLRETADPLVYDADDYDALADAPTVLGSFDAVQFELDGKRHDFVTVPAGSYDPQNVTWFVGRAAEVMRTQRDLFGSLPYDKYVFFYFSPVTGYTGGNLEHASSSIYSGPDVLGELDLGSVTHEFFHLWNVKRIRPAEMWPYDYSRVPTVPTLWVSEGITTYYERLTLYRAGIAHVSLPSEGAGADGARLRPGYDPESAFLADLAFRVTGVETNPQRLPATDASVAYGKGYVLGALLDVSIRYDTAGARGLDDVMRTLYAQHYLKGSGFTAADVLRIVSATAGRDYSDFFNRYVTGVEIPPYDLIFGRAGYRLLRSTRGFGVLAIAANSTPEGRRIYRLADPKGPAALAGLRVGDVILAVDGVPIHQVPLANLFGQNWIGGRFVGRAGERVILRVRRDGTNQDVPVTLGTRNESTIAIEPMRDATAEQLSVRRAWLGRDTATARN